MTYYQDYYETQSGGGNVSSGISRVYIGAPYQRGRGIGAYLGGIFRHVLPLFKRGAKALGKEIFSSGLNVLTDVGKSNAALNDSLRKRTRESLRNLKRKASENLDSMLMEGSGSHRPKTHRMSSHLLNTLTGARLSVGEQRKGKKSKKRRKKKSPLKGAKRGNSAVEKSKRKKGKKAKNNRVKRRKKEKAYNDIFQ